MRKLLTARRHGLGVALAASLAVSSGVVAAQVPADDTSSDEVAEQPVDQPIDEASAIAVARAFVASGSELRPETDAVDDLAQFADASTDAPAVSVSAAVSTEHNNTTSVYLQQTIDGIDIRGAVSVVTVGSSGDVLAANDSFRSTTDAASGASPSLSVVAAAGFAAEALSITPSAAFDVLHAAGDAAQNHELTAAGVSRTNIPARLVFEPVDAKTDRLAWEFLIDSTASNDWWRIRIDAETGDELSRFNLVVHEDDPAGNHGDDPAGAPAADDHAAERFAESSEASFTDGGSSNPVDDGSSYRVFAAPAETPNHTTPVDTRSLVSNPADADASPYGWHDTNGAAGADTANTSGNNVDAGADRNGDNLIDSGSQPSNGGLAFDYPFDKVADPATQLDAVVTNLFYWNNITHDFLYSYGFDEAAGNFQRNNYGKGGLGGDAVIAEAQDTAGLAGSDRETDNANFATPPDGSAPRMQMYVFTLTSPERSSSMDASVVTHEYAHGLSTRLTGGPAYDECLDNEEQQGEGWSDVIALLMTMQGTTAADRTRGIGTYVIGEPTTGLGIRGQRYATGGPAAPGGNTWTYDSIKSGSFSVHAIGAIWAEMLWEMTWALVDEHGYDADLSNGSGGNNIATQLIVDGLKLQPCNPGFVDSRDAVLQADAINNNGMNTCLIWETFAERGLGVNASQGSSDNRLDGVEDFTVPASCDLSFGTAAPAEVGPGDNITYTLTANNGTGGMVTGAMISAPVPSGSTYVGSTCGGSVSGSTVSMTVGSLAVSESKTCTYEVKTSSAEYGARELNDDFATGLSNWRTRHATSTFSNDWELFTYSSGERAATADATDGISDQYLQLAQPISARSNLSMSVLHGFALESGLGSTGYDGGVIEASTNGGSSWVDLGPMMTKNGYNATIDPDFLSPIAERDAFSGNSGSLVDTQIDLSSFAGEDLLVRFRLASDESESALGFWVVPAVQLTNDEVRVETSPTLTSSAGNFTSFASTRVSGEPAPRNLGDVVTPITPVRLLDTRANGETIDGDQEKLGKRDAGSSLKIPVASRSSVPGSAGGVVVNVTAIGPEGTGYFTVHPCLSPVPLASSLNYTTGVNLGNEIVAELDSSGDLCIFTSAKTHITADVVGYLPSSSAYGAVAPARLLDTRADGGLKAGDQIELQVGGKAGVPANAGSVIVNVTAIRPASSGFVTVHSCLSPRPLSSSLNYTAGYTRGNEIVAELDSSGKICLYSSSATNLSVDIVGYLPTGSTINAVTPSRLLDTRISGATVDGVSEGDGAPSAGSTTEVVIGGRGGIPENASSVLMNITAIRPSGTGYVTVAPCGVPLPNASSLNFVGGTNGGNDIIIGLGTDASICIFNSTGTDLSVDVTGYAI